MTIGIKFLEDEVKWYEPIFLFIFEPVVFFTLLFGFINVVFFTVIYVLKIDVLSVIGYWGLGWILILNLCLFWEKRRIESIEKEMLNED